MSDPSGKFTFPGFRRLALVAMREGLPTSVFLDALFAVVEPFKKELAARLAWEEAEWLLPPEDKRAVKVTNRMLARDHVVRRYRDKAVIDNNHKVRKWPGVGEAEWEAIVRHSPADCWPGVNDFEEYAYLLGGVLGDHTWSTTPCPKASAYRDRDTSLLDVRGVRDFTRRMGDSGNHREPTALYGSPGSVIDMNTETGGAPVASITWFKVDSNVN